MRPLLDYVAAVHDEYHVDVLYFDRRWAMTKQVRGPESSRIRRSIADCIRFSVCVSTFDVASSRISMRESSSMARAMVSSCFCPFDMFVPLSERTVS